MTVKPCIISLDLKDVKPKGIIIAGSIYIGKHKGRQTHTPPDIKIYSPEWILNRFFKLSEYRNFSSIYNCVWPDYKEILRLQVNCSFENFMSSSGFALPLIFGLFIAFAISFCCYYCRLLLQGIRRNNYESNCSVFGVHSFSLFPLSSHYSLVFSIISITRSQETEKDNTAHFNFITNHNHKSNIAS